MDTLGPKVTSFSSIILAAGQGTRMKSPLPKGLHPVAGVPMLYRIIKTVKAAGAREVRVVVGYGDKMVRSIVEPLGVVCMKQEKPRGTGDAVLAAQPESLSGDVLIMNGDHPLVEKEDIEEIFQKFRRQKTELSVVTCELEKPGAFGRIIRNDNQLQAIVEAREASEEVKKIKEVNTGIYVTSGKILHQYLPRVKPVAPVSPSKATAFKGKGPVEGFSQTHSLDGAADPQKKLREHCLTDMVSILREEGRSLGTIGSRSHVALGVNSQGELAHATELVFQKVVQRHLKNGVVIIDPKTVYIEESVEIGAGTVIYPGVYIKGQTKVGRCCVLEPNCFLLNSALEDSVQVRAGCYFEDVEVKTKAIIGPYARLRPQTTIGQRAKVGNFVEMKRVDFGDDAKASHLTYLGDAVVGEGTNVGSGTSTCNYGVDKKKHMTKLGKDAFIGSGTLLVAPVSVGDHSYVGAGSVITQDVPTGSLGLARSRQIIKEDYTPKSPTPSSLVLESSTPGSSTPKSSAISQPSQPSKALQNFEDS